jgi:hypothetical protein
MAVGRISGPLLKANLLRDGVDLAFETDLLYLDVINGRVGIKTTQPFLDLSPATRGIDVVGTTRTTDLEATNQADIATFTIFGSTISSTSSTITLAPGGSDPVVYQGTIVTGDLQLSTNVIETTATDADLQINTLGTGRVVVGTLSATNDVLINGDLHVTGNLTVDGDMDGTITIGDANTDNVEFKADIASDILPDQSNTYDLGSDPLSGGSAWKTAYIKDVVASTVTANSVLIDGIDLALPQGNILYVAKNGNDANSGVHEHDPYLTIKHALGQTSSGDTVYIYPGIYEEIFPLTIPVGVTVRGSSIRSVNIQPTVGTNDKDAFLVNGETTIEDLSIGGFFYNSIDDTGYAIRFSDNFTVTTRSPYIRNITVITRGSVTSSSDPYGFDQNDAGKGALADGSIVNASSKEASLLFHSCTFFTPNQETITATNGVRIEWLNSFTYFADKGLYAYSGATGFAGVGLTRLRIDNRVGSWTVGDLVTYYDTDGTTELASGTIASVDSNYINLTGKQLGFQTITDRLTKTVYAQGDAKLSTAQKKFGTASLALDGAGDYITVPTQPDLAFGTDDFTIEAWVYRTVATGTQTIFDLRSAGTANAPLLYFNGGSIIYYVAGSARITGAASVPNTGVWYHIALARSGTDTKLFVDGTQVGSTWTDTTDYQQNTLYIGASYTGSAGFVSGYIDDIRISKGIARYTTTFVAPTSALTGDLTTVLLLHFNGANNSTTFLDDGVTLQDLRTSAGGTASLINFADYSDFGAEVRSIGSANVYGTYGTYGDGDGVIVYLISQNYAYVGSGKLSTNDPNDRIAANEVVEENRAKIYYTSVDNEGNFSVGDNFYVNQKTGEVLFNNQALSITSATGVTFTDGVNTTTITATNIDTGNIRISGNTVESLTGDLNITAASGAINLQNNTYVTGNLDVTGDITIGGDIQIGDQTTDNINFVGSINSNLVPATNAFYDLGTTSLRWKDVYLNRAEVDGLTIDDNVIQTTIGNDDLTLIANGTGRIYVPSSDVQIDQNLTVTTDLTVTTGTTYLKNLGIDGTITQTGDIQQTGNFVTSGNTQVTGNITATGYLELPQIKLDGNVISTRVSGTDLELQANGTGNIVVEGIKFQDNNIQSVVTNSDITLTPQGTGSVIVNSNQSLIIPVGTTLERPVTGTETNGMIRYNTTLEQYEGWNGTYWLKLSGVQDLDGNTYIKAEATPGANDNTLYFYADNNLMVTIDSTKLFAERLQTANLDISGNTISSIDANTDINLTTSGTGGVKIGNLRIRNNTITNIVSGAITDFAETGDGYVKISGTNGVVIPSGVDNQRPGNAVAGMMRFNTEQALVEVFNGVSWTSVAGTSSGVTFNEATDIGIGIVLTLG